MSRPAPLLLLLAALLFFFALGNHQLQGSTEARVAGIAMQMHLDDDWVTPRLFGQPFLEKPPLSLWLDASAIRVFGGTPWAVRLASAFAGLFSVMLLYAMLRRFGRPTAVAWVAGAMLATMASYWGNVRGVGEDALLSLGVTLALLAFFQTQRRQAEGQPATLGWLLFALGIAIATLSKGVLGLAMPGVVIFAYLLADSLIEKRFALGHWLKPALLTVLGLVPLLIWLYLLYQRGGLQALGEVLWTNSVGRFDGSFVEAGHYEPFYYYLAKLPQAFLPWNILVYLGLWHFRKSLVKNRYLLFFSLWLLAQFTLLCLASSKRTVYLMSLTPAAAVLAAEYATVLYERLRLRAAGEGFWSAVGRQRRAGHWRADAGGVQLPGGRAMGRTTRRSQAVLRAADQRDPDAAGRRATGGVVSGQRTRGRRQRVLHPEPAQGCADRSPAECVSRHLAEQRGGHGAAGRPQATAQGTEEDHGQSPGLLLCQPLTGTVSAHKKGTLMGASQSRKL